MSTLDDVTQGQADALVAQLAAVQDAQSQLEQRADALKAQLRALLPGPGSYAAGGLRVALQANRRLDAAAVAERYPAAAYPQLYKTAPDTTAVRRHLAPAEVDALMVDVGEPKLVIR